MAANCLFRPRVFGHTGGLKPARFLLLAATVLLACGLPSARAQSTVKKKIDTGFAPIEAVRPVLERVLSPQGRFVMLPGDGSVMVIDTREGILAAESALGQAELPVPEVALDFEFRSGLPSRKTKIVVGQEVPLPAAYSPPTILVGPNGRPYGEIPSTPTQFVRRQFGVTSETNTRLNPDGSITMDINTESTEFEGFINYGSAILPAGTIGTVPVSNRVGDPLFFDPFVNAGAILMPIVRTTRISTSVVIRPRVQTGTVSLDLMPRLTVEVDEEGVEDQQIDLRQFRTTVNVGNNQVGRVNGFAGASPEFNRHFLGGEDPKEGETAIVVRASVRPAAGKGAEDGTPSPAETIPTSRE